MKIRTSMLALALVTAVPMQGVWFNNCRPSEQTQARIGKGFWTVFAVWGAYNMSKPAYNYVRNNYTQEGRKAVQARQDARDADARRARGTEDLLNKLFDGHNYLMSSVDVKSGVDVFAGYQAAVSKGLKDREAAVQQALQQQKPGSPRSATNQTNQ